LVFDVATVKQEQLGLRLDSQKGPIDMLLIDHAEKPTEKLNAGVRTGREAAILCVQIKRG
jgi:hypothetical protein